MEKEPSKLVPMPAWPRRNVEWPTVLFAAVVFTTLAASWGLFFFFRGPFWVISPIVNVLCVYACFTILHEAAHRNIFRDRDSHGNDVLGGLAGLVMHGSFEQFVGIHLKHHASVNDPEEDPDFHARAPLSFKRLMAWIFTVPHYFYEFRRLHLKKGRSAFLIAVPYLFLSGAYIAAFFGHWLPELLLLYTLPALIGVGFTVFVFDYLPHHPHNDRSRYGNATVYDHPKWNWIFMGHSFHIVHHLWPSIPWYRYRKLYYDARGELLEAGVREGSVTEQVKAL
jgi:beta-carotene hydroxylase